MDFPIFELPFFGNKLFIAVIGVIHVLISHGCAIGGSLFVVLLERRSIRTGDRRWNDLAFRLLRVFVVLTTTAGALTGVGIWLVTAIVSPYGIGSLLRIFFWAWAVEWLIFLIELALILTYYLTWHRMDPRRHIKIGAAYVLFSYFTVVVIVGILGAMLTPGKWLSTRAFWDGYLNATFIQQLASRTAMAVLLACGFVLLISAFLKIDKDIRKALHAFIGPWLAGSAAAFVMSSFLYYRALPDMPEIVVAVAFNTKAYEEYLQISKLVIPFTGGLLCLAGAALVFFGARVRRWALVLPILMAAGMAGQYERVREFVRKPYVIYGYMYSNGIRVAEESFLRETGILGMASWARWQRPEEVSTEEMGQRVFRIECLSCHTYRGVNGVFRRTRGWSEESILDFIRNYRHTHPYMPPFIGTSGEAEALARFLYGREEQK